MFERDCTYGLSNPRRFRLESTVKILLLLAFSITMLFLMRNASGELEEDPYWESNLDDKSYCVAWGDYDKDGDLDLAVSNYGPNHIYENVNGKLTIRPIWESRDTEDTKVTQEVMWGDIDANGWIDLVAVNGAWGAGFDVVYLNFGGNVSTTANWTNDNSDQSAGMDLGDYDGDGDLDLVTSNYNGRECVYENRNGMFTTSPTWQSYFFDDGTLDVTFFDVDGDNDLDLFFGCSATMDSKDSNANRVYINDPGMWGDQRFGLLPDWISNDELWTTTVKAADMDKDGDTDIIAANGYNNCNLVVMYENTGSSLNRDYTWSIEVIWPYGCDIGDVNGDGWLDVGISSNNEKVYLVMNDNGILDDELCWNSTDTRKSYRCAWGDMDGDGFPDLGVANYNTMQTPGNNVVYVKSVERPGVTVDHPKPNEKVNDIVMITGHAKGSSENKLENVEISYDYGESWHTAEGTEVWSFEWNTTQLDHGEYIILASAKAGPVYSRTALVCVNITTAPENHPPTIEIIRPGEEGEEADEEFVIEWEATDDDGDNLTIELYFDTDTDPENGRTLIASELSNTGNYEWDTSEMDEGEYYTCAVVDDNNGSQAAGYSVGTVVIDHVEQVNHDPEIDMIAVEEIDEYTLEIRWSAADADEDSLLIDLYYDTDTDPDNGKTLIVDSIENSGSYYWDISGMEDGEYHVRGVVTDSKGGEGEDYSKGFSIELPVIAPDFTILSVDIVPTGITEGDSVAFRFTVRNLGSVTGSGKVEFLIDGVPSGEWWLTLHPGGKDYSIVLIWDAIIGNHTISVKISVPDDPDQTNNEMVKTIVVGRKIAEKKESDDEQEYYYLGTSLVIAGVIIAGIIVRKGRGRKIRCPECGGKATYYEEYDDHYCNNCEEYVSEWVM